MVSLTVQSVIIWP